MALLLSLYHSKGRWFISNPAESPVLPRATTRGGPRERVSALRPALPRCESVLHAHNRTASWTWALPATRRHREIVVRFEGLLQARPDRKLRMVKICGDARRLRPDPVLLCAKHLGMSPTSYLRRRPMSLVYRALWCGDPDATNVSEAARRYGFRGLGRFPGAFRHLFGGLPSASLRWSLHPGMAHLVLRRLCRPRVKLPTLIGEGTKR